MGIYITESIAYFNLGVNQEHLKKWADALRFYNLALKVTEIHLPKGHALNATIEGHLEDVKQKR